MKPKYLVKTIRSPAKLAKATFGRTRHIAEPDNRQYASPNEYAIDKSSELATNATSKTVNAVHGVVRCIPSPKVRIRDTFPYGAQNTSATRSGIAQPRPHRPRPANTQPNKIVIQQAQTRYVKLRQAQSTQAAHSIKTRQMLRSRAARAGQATSQPANAGKRGIKAASRTAKAPKLAVKAGMKSAKAGKVAIKSGKTAVKTIQTTAKTARTAGQTARFVARTAARVAAVSAKLTARAAIALAKIAAASAKAVMTMLAAGGGLLLLIIAAFAVVAAILGSPLGVFFSNESADGMPMTEAIVEINTGFTNDLQARIDELSNDSSYDFVVASYDGDYDGDAAMVNNWQDVLGVYAVKTVSDEEAGTEVITLNPEKIEELRKVFMDMNTVEITTTEEIETTYDEHGDPVTTITLHIDIRIRSMTYQEGAAFYNFNAKQLETLEELMSPEYYELFAVLLSVDVYDGLTAADLTQITNNLPVGTRGTVIVEAALAAVGTPYSKMDCSQLTRHAYAAAGVSLPRTSVEQAKYCYNGGYMVGAGQLQPGDLVFWSKSACKCGRWNEIHHVGVYIGNGKIVDASSAQGRVVLRDLWNGSNWFIYGFARPHV